MVLSRAREHGRAAKCTEHELRADHMDHHLFRPYGSASLPYSTAATVTQYFTQDQLGNMSSVSSVW